MRFATHAAFVAAAAAAAAFLSGCNASASASASSAGDTTPMRIVRIGHANADAFRQNIEASVQGCQVVLHMAPAAAQLPSAEALRKFAVLEEEELFDGQMWALYTTQRSLGADPLNGCRLTEFVHRSVDIEKSCEWRVRGGTQLIGQLASLADPKPPAPPKINEQKLTAMACQHPRETPPTAGLPLDTAGGSKCVWSSDILRAMAAKAGLPGGSAGNADAFDRCQYDKRPYYRFQNLLRPVVLKTRGGTKSLAGNDMAQIMGELQAMPNHELAELSDGGAVPAERFTRTGAESFLRQPVKRAYGG